MATTKKPKRPPWGIQAFLNDPTHHDKGWLKGTVIMGWGGKPDIQLHVADCSRVINLDFDVSSEEEVAARIVKVETLRDTINAFSREALKVLKEYQRTEARKAAAKANAKPAGTKKTEPF